VLLMRYVTRASERFGLRNRLYQRVIELMHKESSSARPEDSDGAGTTGQ